ncbi:MAG: ABC transporter ATP-binding protein [Clostridia bacterium]|nr:ABC transporter ATP-binding protein [Clostridia bacterium]
MKMKRLLLQSIKDIFMITPGTIIMQVICMLGQSVLTAVSTWMVSVFLNDIYETNFEESVMSLGIILGIFAVSEVGNSIFYSCMIKIDAKTAMKLGRNLGEKGSRLSLIQYEDTEINNKLKRAQNSIEQGKFSDLSLSVFNILSEALKVGSTLIILTSFSPILAAISLLSVIPYFLIRIIRGKEFYELKNYQAAGERCRDYLYHLFADRRAVKELRIYGIEEYIEEKLYRTRDGLNKEIWDYKRKDIKSLFWCDIFCRSGYIISMFIAVLLLLAKELDFGMLAASITAFSSFQLASKYFLISLGRIPECASFVNDYYTFMNLEEERMGGDKLDMDFTNIKVSNLCFSYPNTSNPALSHVDFSIDKKETVAVVGENGSGKSTLIKVLTGLYPVQSGKVMYGNQDIHSLDPKDLRSNISMVSQDFVKYEMSLRENTAISDWRYMKDSVKIQRTLDKVGLSNIQDIGIESLDQILGNEFGGKELSIGQWQKLAIARGMFRESQITVLDEPTAALDPVMETSILKMFLRIAKDKTTIIVSHRIGICRAVDKIIVMKEGKVCEVGSHKELIEKQGEYYRLYMMQRQWYVE